jgi:chemotaxis protein CheX
MSVSCTEDDLRVIAEQVWSSYLDLDGASPLVPVPAENNKIDVSASVSLTGAWRGHVIVRCSATASRNAAAALLGVELDDVTIEDVTDALGELANIIGGNVKSLLPEPSALSLPHVLVEEAATARWPAVNEVCELRGTWLDEPVSVSVLESIVDNKHEKVTAS